MSYSIDTLALEVTRRCNMRCRHCLRGGAQRINMPNDMIYTAMRSFDSIRTICFTGGEPTLNARGIIYAMGLVRFCGLQVFSFDITINGAIFHQEMMDELTYFYNHMTDDPGVCGLRISQDQYHDEFQNKRYQRNLERYLEYPFAYLQDKKAADRNPDRILYEGRGKDLSYHEPITHPERCHSRPQLDEIYDGTKHYEGTLYVNAKGDLQTCVNLSYVSQEKFKVGRYDDIHGYLDRCEKTKHYLSSVGEVEDDGEGIAL